VTPGKQKQKEGANKTKQNNAGCGIGAAGGCGRRVVSISRLSVGVRYAGLETAQTQVRLATMSESDRTINIRLSAERTILASFVQNMLSANRKTILFPFWLQLKNRMHRL
jgi:hypothetical protein